mgnify:CR=1 FL=1
MINLINTTFAHMGQANEAGEFTDYHFGMMNGTMGWFGFGWIFMVAIFTLLVLGIIALAKYIRNDDKKDK